MSRRKNFRQLADRIVTEEKCRDANSKNTFYFSQLDIFPPSGDPALETFHFFIFKYLYRLQISVINSCFTN